jgi:hypothetical protein
VIAVIGIDRYAEWPRLANAVSDARAAARLFTDLGFEQMTAPLLDEAATGDAMRRLVTEELAQLSPEDSLVVFFAGHGHTHTADFGDTSVKTGYVIPVDGARPRGHVSASWLRLDAWLSDIARLPPRHILVLVDACHSGVALSALHRWRDDGQEPAAALAALAARRSRRVITSALDDQRAMDGGPYPGHSLFTGCLIEALSGALAEGGQRVATGRELGQYLQQRVRSYPSSTQTPDFGTFELDDRGDIALPTSPEPRVMAPAPEPDDVDTAAAPRPDTGTSGAVAGLRRRAWIGPRLAIGATTGALVALALVVAHRVAGNQDRTAQAPASDVRISDTLDPAPGAVASRSIEPTAAPGDVAPSGGTPASPPRPPAHRALNRPVAAPRRDRNRVPATEHPSEPRTPPSTAMPDDQQPSEPADAPASWQSRCSKAAFAAVYEARSPAPATVSAALGELRACHDAGALSESDFTRYQIALVAKL